MNPALSVSSQGKDPLGIYARLPHQHPVASPPIDTSTMGDETVISET